MGGSQGPPELPTAASSPSSDSTEATLEDNVVQLSAPIRYEPDLFLSR